MAAARSRKRRIRRELQDCHRQVATDAPRAVCWLVAGALFRDTPKRWYCHSAVTKDRAVCAPFARSRAPEAFAAWHARLLAAALPRRNSPLHASALHGAAAAAGNFTMCALPNVPANAPLGSSERWATANGPPETARLRPCKHIAPMPPSHMVIITLHCHRRCRSGGFQPLDQLPANWPFCCLRPFPPHQRPCLCRTRIRTMLTL